MIAERGIIPMTTVMLAVITSVTGKPTNAKAYWVAKFPTLKSTPPTTASNTDGQLSYTKVMIPSIKQTQNAKREKGVAYICN